MSEVLRQHAEQQFAEELHELSRAALHSRRSSRGGGVRPVPVSFRQDRGQDHDPLRTARRREKRGAAISDRPRGSGSSRPGDR